MAGRKERYRKFKKAHKEDGAALLYTEWYDRAVYSLKVLISDNEDFNKDIELVRQKTESNDVKALYIMKKYNLQHSMSELLRHYITNDEINPFFMRPPVIAISTRESIAGPSLAHNNGRRLKQRIDEEMKTYPKDWVYLLIDPECTQGDIEEWISIYWKSFMQDRLDTLKPKTFKRISTRKFLKRDQDIYRHIKVEGAKPKVIAEKYNMTPEYARKIARDMQNEINKAWP